MLNKKRKKFTMITYHSIRQETQRNIFEMLLNQTGIRLYLSFSNWFGTANGRVRLVPNQSENGKYNLISGWFDKIPKRLPCVHIITSCGGIRPQTLEFWQIKEAHPHERWSARCGACYIAVISSYICYILVISSYICYIFFNAFPDEETQYKFRKFGKFQLIYFSLLNFKDIFNVISCMLSFWMRNLLA